MINFRYNQLSLYVNLVCFDRISSKDSSLSCEIRRCLTGFLVRTLQVYRLKISARPTSARMKSLTGKALKHMQSMFFYDCE